MFCQIVEFILSFSLVFEFFNFSVWFSAIAYICFELIIIALHVFNCCVYLIVNDCFDVLNLKFIQIAHVHCIANLMYVFHERTYASKHSSTNAAVLCASSE